MSSRTVVSDLRRDAQDRLSTTSAGDLDSRAGHIRAVPSRTGMPLEDGWYVDTRYDDDNTITHPGAVLPFRWILHPGDLVA